MVKSACGCRRVAPAVRAVICGFPEPNKLQICPESCFGLQGLEEDWEALVSASFAWGARFERFYCSESLAKAVNPLLQLAKAKEHFLG